MSPQRWQDLNVISSLLKSFFRKLPEPLFTDGASIHLFIVKWCMNHNGYEQWMIWKKGCHWIIRIAKKRPWLCLNISLHCHYRQIQWFHWRQPDRRCRGQTEDHEETGMCQRTADYRVMSISLIFQHWINLFILFTHSLSPILLCSDPRPPRSLLSHPQVPGGPP